MSRRGRGLLALTCLLVAAWFLSSVIGRTGEALSPNGAPSGDQFNNGLDAATPMPTLLALPSSSETDPSLGGASGSVAPITDATRFLPRSTSESFDPDLAADWDVDSATEFPRLVMRGQTTTTTLLATTTVESTPSVAAPTRTTAPATVTTWPPIPTATTAIVPPGSVELWPGDDVASIVSAAATGTTFWFTPGTYTGVSIVPKANQVFLGASGAVLAGNGKAFAFRSAATGVTIKGLVIEGYVSASRAAVVDGVDGGSGWTVSGNEVRYNNELGIRAIRDWTVTGNYVHHNGRYGITGSGAGVLVENNEIAYNANLIGATGDSSGTKFAHTTDLVLRGNYAHNNLGSGLWVDINNVNALIENNRSIANTHQGIFLEISCGGTIRNNYVEGNGTDNRYPNWVGEMAGITISMTPDVQVYGNTLVNNTKGIGAIQWAHPNVGAVTKCLPQMRNLRAYNNTITQTGSAAAGIDASKDQVLVYGSWDNQFYSNTYNLSGGAQFRFDGVWMGLAEWNSNGLS